MLPKDDEDISLLSELPAAQTEPQGFSPEQMVRCDECLRANPPTRVECLYCGKALLLNDAALAQARPLLRPLEKWEQGYNNILVNAPEESFSDQAIVEAAGLLRLEADELRQILLTRKPLPLARTAAHSEAVIIEQGLGALGWQTRIVSDQDLAFAASPPRRLRTVDLRESDLLAHHISGSEETPIEWSAIVLVISGRLFSRQVEFRERKGRVGSEKEILDASETSSDESVLDIYTNNQGGGWRIMANNFDFSCLGNRKTLLASENFSTLSTVIRDHAPGAAYDDSYNSLRRVLEFVWPSERQTESRGWQRGGPRKFSTIEVTMTNNEPQFTRYSRLCHFLKVAAYQR